MFQHQIPVTPRIGTVAVTKKSKWKTLRWGTITKANNYYRYGRKEVLKNNQYPLFNGTGINGKYVGVYEQKEKRTGSYSQYLADPNKDPKKLPKKILPKENLWESDQWIYSPNAARIAYILGAKDEYSQDLLMFIEEGFPTMSARWFINTLPRYSTCEDLKKQLPSMYYGLATQQLFAQCHNFWSCQTNKDLFYSIHQNRNGTETVKFKNVLEVTFDQWIIAPLPAPQQIWSTAAMKHDRISRKMYVCIFLLCLSFMFISYVSFLL